MLLLVSWKSVFSAPLARTVLLCEGGLFWLDQQREAKKGSLLTLPPGSQGRNWKETGAVIPHSDLDAREHVVSAQQNATMIVPRVRLTDCKLGDRDL